VLGGLNSVSPFQQKPHGGGARRKSSTGSDEVGYPGMFHWRCGRSRLARRDGRDFEGLSLAESQRVKRIRRECQERYCDQSSCHEIWLPEQYYGDSQKGIEENLPRRSAGLIALPVYTCCNDACATSFGRTRTPPFRNTTVIAAGFDIHYRRIPKWSPASARET
jgi:hypothetical protein